MKTTMDCPLCQRSFTRVHTAKKPPLYCSRSCARRAPGRMTPEWKQKIARALSGPLNHNFKGGGIRTNHGRQRAYVWLTPDERIAFGVKESRMLRARYVWNKAHPDDPLRPGEVIHHRDGDTLNDAPGNLEKVVNQALHAALHNRGSRRTVEQRARMARAQQARAAALARPLGSCERCAATLTRFQTGQGNRFCSSACAYTFSRGKPRAGW